MNFGIGRRERKVVLVLVELMASRTDRHAPANFVTHYLISVVVRVLRGGS